VKAVLTHKAASIYDDRPEERYHFPETYLRPAQAAIDDFILYYEPRGRVGAHDRNRSGRRAYVAVARVTGVRPDPARRGFFYADIDPETYVTFERPVPFRQGEHYFERQLRREDGGTSKGAFGRAVRAISDPEFNEILAAGFAAELAQGQGKSRDLILPAGMMEAPADFERPVIERILSRPVRDAAFRQAIQTAYDSTCAITGIKLINGGGRSEAQAAHIRPVAQRGPDSIRNGVALSGTVHWMFDRGLVSLGDPPDYPILLAARGCRTACDACSTPTCCCASRRTSAFGQHPPTPSSTDKRSSRAERPRRCGYAPRFPTSGACQMPIVRHQ
jgi:putative restriction endonuclease